jgi:predicted MFS family arabinose efflux permease
VQVDNKKLLFLVSLGAVLEYYDFAIFIYLAPTIGMSLIPAKNQIVNLILSYAIFSIAGLFRPLGGLFFSHIGDTRGRKFTFLYTILLMAIPTFLIAFIPSASTIGIWAVVLLISLRILQGLAIGGEVPGSIVFAYELSSLRQKAINSSIVIMGTNIGFVVASIVCTVLFTPYFIRTDSWRYAFILGGLFGVLSYFLRKSLTETPEFINYKTFLSRETVPVKLLFAKHIKPLLQLLGLGCFFASSLAVFTFYMPSYLSTFYHLPIKTLMQFNTYTIIIFIIGSLLSGLFDKYFGRKFFIYFIVLFLVAVLLLFYNYSILSLSSILSIHVILLLGIGIICGRFPVISASFFPVAVRYSGVAFVYNISFGIVAGCSQLVLTWLIKVTGILWIPSVYLAVFASFALISLLTMRSDELVNYKN